MPAINALQDSKDSLNKQELLSKNNKLLSTIGLKNTIKKIELEVDVDIENSLEQVQEINKTNNIQKLEKDIESEDLNNSNYNKPIKIIQQNNQSKINALMEKSKSTAASNNQNNYININMNMGIKDSYLNLSNAERIQLQEKFMENSGKFNENNTAANVGVQNNQISSLCHIPSYTELKQL
ncbi:hypothetical protein PPERSA_04887 [Pseudocohnilembus persalinus]|uniref:Uncharacterized protein n=1 Tax=Pseudocohnilembus persalinus TaxID=266149 RepID=A0A0V0QJ52_PSEPJ|nr:hypothetical protein PPERSA_04887 [Pseudocohnilembus persalinus]|eukprot:KRX02265.1 hypothetical protein PPERSA_04887 [Pseudocohnilembus persalinus]